MRQEKKEADCLFAEIEVIGRKIVVENRSKVPAESSNQLLEMLTFHTSI